MKFKIKIDIKKLIPRFIIKQKGKVISDKKKYNRQKEKFDKRRNIEQ